MAGTGQLGYSGDGGLAIAANINYPYGIVLDSSSSDVYFSDSSNFRIRKITKSTGIITTVAGTGVSGYSGDAGLATAAKIGTVLGLALDSSSGNIYIADSGNYVIRMITKSTGIISTVAGTGKGGYSGDGGQAALAKIAYSTDLALYASAGLLYIADEGNGVIRVITLSTGVISTVAGMASTSGYSGDGGLATSAALYLPSSIDVDLSSGNIYIADSGNYVIRMITKSTGIISTVAGTGISGYSGDSGLAAAAQISFSSAVRVDSSTGDVYIDDTENCCIRVIAKTSGIIITTAGTGVGGCGYIGDGMLATDSLLQYPNSLAVNTGIGAFYISDGGNNRIRSIFEKSSGSATPRPTASPNTARPTRTSAPTGLTHSPTIIPSGPSVTPTVYKIVPTASPIGPTVKPTRAPSGRGILYFLSLPFLKLIMMTHVTAYSIDKTISTTTTWFIILHFPLFIFYLLLFTLLYTLLPFEFLQCWVSSPLLREMGRPITQVTGDWRSLPAPAILPA